MSYVFDIIGVSPILNFFNYQQKFEQNRKRSKAYLGTYQCTLDGFIQATEMIPQKPDWNWDDVVTTLVNFWLTHSDQIQYWKTELETLGTENLIVARVANLKALQTEFESLFAE